MPRTATLKQDSPNGTKPRVFDLSQRFVRDVVEVVIPDPLDKTVDTGIRIGLRSVYSKEARDAARAARAQIVLDENGNVVSSPTETGDAMLEQTIGATAYWFHADLTKPRRPDGTWEREEGFEDGILIAGETIPCTPETVRSLYSDPKTAWIHRPVLLAYANIAGFFEPPKTA